MPDSREVMNGLSTGTAETMTETVRTTWSMMTTGQRSNVTSPRRNSLRKKAIWTTVAATALAEINGVSEARRA